MSDVMEKAVVDAPVIGRAAADKSGILFPTGHSADWISKEELAKLTPADLVRRASALKPLLAANAREAERSRKPVDAVWSEIRQSGVFYHFVPKKHGGLEFDLSTFFESMFALSGSCTSTAWVTAFCVLHNWILAQFPEKAQEEIFAQSPYIVAPAVAAPTGQAKRVEGGYRLTGRWKWCTGVMHADWMLATGLVENEGAPPSALFFVLPITDVTIIDTWHFDGMSGTGSHDCTIEDVFIPVHRAADLAELRAGRGAGATLYENPIYRMPMLPFLTFMSTIPALGAAKQAVEQMTTHMSKRVIYGSTATQSTQALAQAHLARAELNIRAAELLIRDGIKQIDTLAAAPEPCTVSERLSLRANLAYAVELCQQAVSTACHTAGSSAHNLENPLQRVLRDINMISTHLVFDIDAATESFGRSLLGLEPNSGLV